ncbi:hypothetical protein LTR08_003663 [Meristemomyces frigidus]|nr:hypothetical protein LTR08_003663 [Meristemomyces frigidus]
MVNSTRRNLTAKRVTGAVSTRLLRSATRKAEVTTRNAKNDITDVGEDPVQAVFGVAELIECILLSLPPASISSMLRVSEMFYNVITSSAALKKQLFLYDMKITAATKTTPADEVYEGNWPLEKHAWSPIRSTNSGFWQMTFQAPFKVPGTLAKRAAVIFCFSQSIPEERVYGSISVAGGQVKKPEAGARLTEPKAVLKPGWLLENLRLIKDPESPIVVWIQSPAEAATDGRGIELLVGGGTSVAEVVRTIDAKLRQLRQGKWSKAAVKAAGGWGDLDD